MTHVNEFEKERIVDAWYDFLKIYLSIWKKTQQERLKKRGDVRKRWKSSPIDAEAQEKWNHYTLAKEKILRETDTRHAPWIVLDSNEKFLSSIEIIKAIIGTNEGVRKLIENELSISLKPNKKVRRTAQEELQKMEREWQIPTRRKFKFREV